MIGDVFSSGIIIEPFIMMKLASCDEISMLISANYYDSNTWYLQQWSLTIKLSKTNKNNDNRL